MESFEDYDLVTLQFNLGAASMPVKKSKRSSEPSGENNSTDGQVCVSKHVGRYLVHKYLSHSVFPNPAFIALQDGFNDKDVESICEAMKKRSTGDIAEYLRTPTNQEKKDLKALLLYNNDVFIYDTDNCLSEEDFFCGSDVKRQRLFNRLNGGLFQHKVSKQFVVAISYHGQKKDSKNDEKKEYVSGKHISGFRADSRELLGKLVNKYIDKKPIYIVMGDFNLDLEAWRAEDSRPLKGWELYHANSHPARDLRDHSIDYVLIKVPDGAHFRNDKTQGFSPLPLTVSHDGDVRTYSLPKKPGLLNEGVTFATQDLKDVKLTNSVSLHSNYLLKFLG